MDRDGDAYGRGAGGDGGSAGGAPLSDVDTAGVLTAPGGPGFSPEWLALREPADAAARADELLGPLRAQLARQATRPLVIRDLGCGTGSFGRWLAGRLPGPQHWVLCDRDPDLLAYAGASGLGPAADTAPVTAEVRERDVTELTAADLADTSLVVASALADLLTADEVARLAEACTASGCAALLALSVTGQVELAPADPLDAELTAAFNAHQRRVTGNRRLLGPDAGTAARAAFEHRGARVYTAPSPWRLGPTDAGLTAQWLRGWVAAATEQRPELAGPAKDYLHRRLAACAAGELRVVVDHVDLLALPGERKAGVA